MFEILKTFEWGFFRSVHGSSHSSIIGFLSYEWIKRDPLTYSVLDGAPSPEVGGGRVGQVNADLLLLKEESPKVIVEVETVNWVDKIDNICKYFESRDLNFKKAKGLLILTRLKVREREGEMIYSSQKQVNDLKQLRTKIENSPFCISLVEIWRKKIAPDNIESFFRKMQKRSDYYDWHVDAIKYWDKTGYRKLL